MNDHDRLAHLNTGLRDGDSTIAEELDRQFRQRLCDMIDRRMNQLIRRRHDPEDVVQSVMRSFFVRAGNGEFYFENREALWGLLKKIARRKLSKRIVKEQAAKRDIRIERYDVGLIDEASDDVTSAQAYLLGDLLEQALSELPAPVSDIFKFTLYGYSVAEVIEIVLRDLDPLYAKILQLRLQGLTEQKIADEIGCLRGEVRYKLNRLRQRLGYLLGDVS